MSFIRTPELSGCRETGFPDEHFDFIAVNADFTIANLHRGLLEIQVAKKGILNVEGGVLLLKIALRMGC
jgi:hypothetical protein